MAPRESNVLGTLHVRSNCPSAMQAPVRRRFQTDVLLGGNTRYLSSNGEVYWTVRASFGTTHRTIDGGKNVRSRDIVLLRDGFKKAPWGCY